MLLLSDLPAQDTQRTRPTRGSQGVKSRRAQKTPKTQEELKELYAKKLDETWFKDAGWIDDYDLARQLAVKEKKFIFAYFTRTYAP